MPNPNSLDLDVALNNFVSIAKKLTFVDPIENRENSLQIAQNSTENSPMPPVNSQNELLVNCLILMK